MSKNSVTFLYDPISPWSYIALVLLKRNQQAWNLDITLQPAALGYMFQASGNRAPLVVRNKGKMMAQEFKLFTDYYQIPVSEKAWTFSMEAQQKPPNSLPLTRFLYIIQQSESSKVLDEITIKIFEDIFAKGDTELFSSVSSNELDKLFSIIGNNVLTKEKIKQYLEKSNSKEIKDLIKSEAKKYVDNWNVYGVPWIRIKRFKDGQIKNFMGSDRFELIAAWLGVPYKVQSQSKL